jgi:hypothetical protein
MRTSTAVLMLLLMACAAEPASARGIHDYGGTHHEGNAVIGSEAGFESRRHGNTAYAKAKIEERDRLLGKLKSICRGC